MRKIEVDVDVFAGIWSHRRKGEDNENQIIKRILQEWKAPTSVPTESPDVLSALMRGEFGIEVNTSKAIGERKNVVGKIRWVDDIRVCLTELGGRASLHQIYQAVERRRREGGRSLPKTLEAVIRRTLEDHSSDSANFRAADLFALVGRGEWALRSIVPKE